MIPEIPPCEQVRAVFAPCVNHELCRTVAEICHDMNRSPSESKNTAVLNIVEEDFASAEHFFAFSEGNHFLYEIRDHFLRLVFALSAPVTFDSVNPAAVFFFAFVVAVRIIVEQSLFIACIQKRNARQSHLNGVHHLHSVHSHAAKFLIVELFCLLQAREARHCSADSAVPCAWIELERLTCCKTSFKAACEEAVQKLPVIEAVDSKPSCILVAESPANVVVTSDIIDPCAILRNMPAIF